MATVATSTQNPVLQYPTQTLIDRNPIDGFLYVLIKGSTANTFDVYRSTDNGGSWTLYVSLTRANVREIGSVYITNVNWMHWCYRVNESGQDRIYWRRLNLTNATWSGEVLTGNPSNGGVADSVHTGLDMIVTVQQGQEFVAIAVGTKVGTNYGVTLYGVRIGTNGVAAYANDAVFTGTRQWLTAATAGAIVPSIDIEHNGDGKTAGTAHLWVTWGTSTLYCVRLAWQWRWNGPSKPTKVVDLSPAQVHIAGRWIGDRFVVAVPHPEQSNRIMIYQRTVSNSANSLEAFSPVHAAGVVRNVSFSYDSVTRNIRLYSVGTNNNDLYFVDRVALTGAFSTWATVTTTDILGTTPNQYSVRRGSLKSRARYDVLTAHAGSPNTVVHTAQSLTYTPNAPAWNFTGIGYPNGAAADVALVLPLDWDFSDPDPTDTQSAYAISRQIGAGALNYWRASDSTWQVSEVKNLSATSLVTLSASWGSTSDDPHHYRVKTWDAADVAGPYGEELTLIPSGKVNPTIDVPAEAAVIGASSVTLEWTVTEQTQFKVRLVILGVELFNSGWITSTDREYTIPWLLASGFNYSAFLQTRNDENLVSTEDQVNFSVSFVAPPVGSIVPSAVPSVGAIRLVVTNPSPVGTQPPFLEQDLWRRPIANAILNPNPDFEVNTTGWLAGVGGTAARDTAVAKFGSASLRLTPDGVTAAPRLESDFIAATAGVQYHYDGWLQADTVNKAVALFFRWFTAADAFISDSSPSYVTPLDDDVFLYYGPIAVAPPTTAKMKLCAGLTATPAAGDRIWLDYARVRVSDPTEGIRVAAALDGNVTYDDWRAVSGVDYEFRAIVKGTNETASFGPWQG